MFDKSIPLNKTLENECKSLTDNVYDCTSFLVKINATRKELNKYDLIEQHHASHLFTSRPSEYTDSTGFALIFDNIYRYISLDMLIKSNQHLVISLLPNVIELTKEFHAHGLVHGDLSFRNIVYSSMTNKVLFTDAETTNIFDKSVIEDDGSYTFCDLLWLQLLEYHVYGEVRTGSPYEMTIELIESQTREQLLNDIIRGFG